MPHDKVNIDERLAFRIADAAVVSGLGKTTLYSLIKSGELPSRMTCGRRLILRRDLEALL
jgi:excisionase family DNA binding protein